MKLTALKIALLSIGLLSLSAIGSSQEEPIESNPGYLNLDSILEGSDQYITSEVYLRNYILRMISKVAQKSEPDFANMLSAIKLIRVVEFQFGDEDALALKKAEQLVSHLSGSHWDTLVRHRDAGEYHNICIQSDREDHIYALAIVSWDNSELTVVNVVGDIDLEMLARLGEQFDIDALEDYEEPATNE